MGKQDRGGGLGYWRGSGGEVLSVGAKLGMYGNRVGGGLMDGSKSRRNPESSSVNSV